MSDLRAGVANTLWVAACTPEWLRFRSALGQVERVQNRLLQGYLARNRDTAYGRRYGFASLRSTGDYQAAVPLTGYDDYAGSVDAIGAGQSRVLTAEPVRMFELSSGSTAASKLIPYTASLKAEFQRGLAAWIGESYRQYPQLARGPAYWSLSPLLAGERHTTCGIPIGFEADSAYLGWAGQFLVEAALAAPNALKRLTHIDAFRYATLLCLLRKPALRLISVWNPTFLSLLLEPLPDWWERLLGDIAAGGLTPPQPIDAMVQAELARQLPPDRPRARALAQADPRDTRTLWPQLALISCWADGPAASYAHQLSEQYFPGVPLQPKGLLATEAFVSFPLRGAAGSVLALTSHFFEFLPLEHDLAPDAEHPRLAHQLERGRRYAVVVTTGGGFYRYQLQDIVEVVDFAGQAPCMRFIGKADRVSDWFGEKLNEGFVMNVLTQLCAEYQLSPTFALLAPDVQAGSFAYALHLELPPGQACGHDFAARLDGALCANFHYGYCRQLGQLRVARVFLVERAGAETYLAVCQAAGQRLGNIKSAVLQKTTGWAAHFAGHWLCD